MTIPNNIKKISFIYLFSILLFSCSTLKVKNYTLDDKEYFNIEGDFLRIIQISDFHSNDFGDKEDKLIEKIVENTPDFIVITGDLFEATFPQEKVYSNVEYLLEGIYELCPIFFVTGNHEYAFASLDEIKSLLNKYNVTILENQTILVQFIQGKVVISGINDPYELQLQQIKEITNAEDADYSYKDKYVENIQKVAVQKKELKNKNDDILFTLLLAHRPEFIDDYKDYDFDLILSGHAHGGQWRFPPFINGLYAPGQGLFPKYAGGKYKFDNGRYFIVCRGLSYQQPDFPRIFNNPELVVIDIYPKISN